MNKKRIADETLNIINGGKYTIDNKTVELPDIDFNDVKVYSPDAGKILLNEEIDRSGESHIMVTTEDSFEAASRYKDAAVMNFANAHTPGGGFLIGASAQEEDLCRCSTLFASISGVKAKEMYEYNNTHISTVASDYMLFSEVCVFRDKQYNLLHEPFVTKVITVPAPNRRGAALFASEKTVEQTMIRRIKIMSLIAYKNGCKNLVLGAWGCGAFGNKPEKVSDYFRRVYTEEGYGKLFDEICFAIYGSEDGNNYVAFRKCFESV